MAINRLNSRHLTHLMTHQFGKKSGKLKTEYFSKKRIKNLKIKTLVDFSTSTWLKQTTNEYKTIAKNENLTNRRIYFQNCKTNTMISPFHDIPLYKSKGNETILNMVVEIPRFTNAKMEINKKDKLNPIIQDSKNNVLRYVNNVSKRM